MPTLFFWSRRNVAVTEIFRAITEAEGSYAEGRK
jgi:hypothetical protein